MSVEGGGIGASIAGVGVAVSVGPTVNIGLEARFGPSIGPSLPIVNEGLVGPVHVENSIPYTVGSLNPVVEIRFNDPIQLQGQLVPESPLSVEAAVAEAEAVMFQAQQHLAKPQIMPQIEYDNNLDDRTPYWHKPQGHALMGEYTLMGPYISTSLLTKTENVLGVQTESPPETDSMVDTKPARLVSTQPAVQQQETAAVEEQVTEAVIKPEESEVLEEEVMRERRFYLVDKRALAQRLYEIRQAFRKAVLETKRLWGSVRNIMGKLIARLMPIEHNGNRSEITQPNGPDGSYEVTKEMIGAGQFSSEDQLEAVALLNRPVKIGKEGERVREDEVRKVLKDRVVKPINRVIEIVTTRIVKKKAQTIPGQNPAQVIMGQENESRTKEPSLADYPALAEVFPEAASS